jgi:hypothetical protein
MSNLGCCGSRPPSIGALIAHADSLPANTRRGLIARQRLAYAIVAAKAAQAGNRPMQERALAGLGELGRFTSSDTALTAAASSRIATTVARAAPSGPSPAQILGAASPYLALLTQLADLGADIAGAVPGSDANAITAVHIITSWVRAIINGTPPQMPTLGPNELNSFVDFCRVKAPVKSAIDIAMTSVIAGLTAAGVRDAGAMQAANALTTIKGRIDTMLDGICNIPQIQDALAPAAADCSSVPNAISDGAGGCTCAPGYSSAITPGQCLPEGTSRFQYHPGTFQPGTPFTLLPTACPTGQVRGADGVCRAPVQAGGGLVVPAAVAAAAWFFLK